MVDSDTFRDVMGNFAAGVTVVTLPDPDHGITVNAFASLSLDPTLVLVSIDHDTTAHERLSADADGYCVNVLAGDQRHLGEHFADIDTLEESPFDAETIRREESGAAVFEESLAFLDCSVADTFEAGDHTVYVGAVEAADVVRPDAPALTFFRGEWGTLE